MINIDLGSLLGAGLSFFMQVLQGIRMWIVSQGGYISLGLAVIAFIIGRLSNNLFKGIKSLLITITMVLLIIGLFFAIFNPDMMASVVPEGNESSDGFDDGFFDQGNETNETLQNESLTNNTSVSITGKGVMV